MMLFVPFLAGDSSNIGGELLLMLGKTVALLGVTFVLARWVIQYVLHKIAVSNSQELFLIAIIVFGFAIASFSAWLGLSLALGAFLAGLAISESSYSYQAIGNIVPFRDVFASFFFCINRSTTRPQFLCQPLGYHYRNHYYPYYRQSLHYWFC